MRREDVVADYLGDEMEDAYGNRNEEEGERAAVSGYALTLLKQKELDR